MIFIAILIGLIVASRKSYVQVDDHTDWRDFFLFLDDGTLEDDVIADWKCAVDENEVDMPMITDIIRRDAVEEIPDLFANCRYSHMLASRLIRFYSHATSI